MRYLLPLVSIVLLTSVASCRNPAGPGGEPPPPVESPSLACPPTVVANAPEAPATVSYPAPALTGGTPPVATSCNIASGSAFPAGATDITCKATDAISRSAQCTFQVVVNLTARLRGTRFLAFGDSITEGQVSPPVPGSFVRAVDPVNSYPSVLLGLLRERYPSQASEIVVVNEGFGGSEVVKDKQRFADAVRSMRPEAVLFLQGTNDLNVATAGEIAAAIAENASRALREGVKMVFVSPLLPQVTYRGKGGHPEAILEANAEIRRVVAGLGPNVVLVDSFAAFDPMKEKLIGEDGLHPTVEGYRLLAETFRLAIKANFEAPPATTAARRR